MGSHGRQQGHPVTETALQHTRLQELVAPFADGELSRDEKRAVEDHLRICGRCRCELDLQRELSRALAREPGPGASVRLRRRIEAIGERTAQVSERAFPWNRRWVAVAMAALASIAVVGTALRVRRGGASRPMAEIPVLRDALADCRRAMTRNFPRKADLAAVAEGLQFPIRPLSARDVELFSTWKTSLAGSPAAGLAYRWRGIVVVQYAVPTELLRQQPELSGALSHDGFYSSSELGQGVVAVLKEDSGTLLIANAPPDVLTRLIL
jgi:anti-sigma factor RsiW